MHNETKNNRDIVTGMTQLKKRRSGFTLVELVVVVLILGIIAGVAFPKLLNISTDASESALLQDLAVVRDAIEIYAAQHGATLPGAAGDGTNSAGSELAFINQLTQYSNAAGAVSANKNAAFRFGPYLRSFPKAPIGPQNGNATVDMVSAGTALTGEAAPTEAWRFDYTTGEFITPYNGTSSDGVTTYDQF